MPSQRRGQEADGAQEGPGEALSPLRPSNAETWVTSLLGTVSFDLLPGHRVWISEPSTRCLCRAAGGTRISGQGDMWRPHGLAGLPPPLPPRTDHWVGEPAGPQLPPSQPGPQPSTSTASLAALPGGRVLPS